MYSSCVFLTTWHVTNLDLATLLLATSSGNILMATSSLSCCQFSVGNIKPTTLHWQYIKLATSNRAYYCQLHVANFQLATSNQQHYSGSISNWQHQTEHIIANSMLLILSWQHWYVANSIINPECHHLVLNY